MKGDDYYLIVHMLPVYHVFKIIFVGTLRAMRIDDDDTKLSTLVTYDDRTGEQSCLQEHTGTGMHPVR